MTYVFSDPATQRVSIGVEALHRLLSRTSPLLPAQQRSVDAIEHWLTGRGVVWVDDRMVCEALAPLLGVNVDKTRDHLGAFVGPMLVWATAQPWSQDVQHARVFSVLCNQHFAAQAKTQPLATCIAALDSMLLWLPKLPAALARTIASHALLDTGHKMDWSARRPTSPIARGDERIIAQLLAKLIEPWPDHACCGEPLLTHWTKAMTEYTSGLNADDQAQWVDWILSESTMHPQYKLIACAAASPVAWLATPAQVQLMELLPADEYERFNSIPWEAAHDATWHRITSQESPENINRAMMRRFCPLSERILDCVTTAQDWKNRQAICALMAQMNNPTNNNPGHALPDNFDSEP